jgi:hypothetical protein
VQVFSAVPAGEGFNPSLCIRLRRKTLVSHAGRYLQVLNSDLENGLSLLTGGRL